MIYFISDGTAVKIGTALCVNKRLASLISGNPRELTVLATCDGGRALEQRLHRSLKGRVCRTSEWFQVTPQLRALIAEVKLAGFVLGRGVVEGFIAKAEAAKPNRTMTKEEKAAEAAEFRQRAAKFMREMCDKFGTETVLQYTGQNRVTLNSHLAAETAPGALAIARLGLLDAAAVRELMGFDAMPEAKPKPQQVDPYDIAKLAQLLLGQRLAQLEADNEGAAA